MRNYLSLSITAAGLFFEAYNLPTPLRRWFVKRIIKQFEDEQKQYDDAAAAAKSKKR